MLFLRVHDNRLNKFAGGETLTSKRMNKFGHRNTNSSARFDNLVKTRDETGPKKHKASGVADKNTETKTMGVEIADLSEIPENSAGSKYSDCFSIVFVPLILSFFT